MTRQWIRSREDLGQGSARSFKRRFLMRTTVLLIMAFAWSGSGLHCVALGQVLKWKLEEQVPRNDPIPRPYFPPPAIGDEEEQMAPYETPYETALRNARNQE